MSTRTSSFSPDKYVIDNTAKITPGIKLLQFRGIFFALSCKTVELGRYSLSKSLKIGSYLDHGLKICGTINISGIQITGFKYQNIYPSPGPDVKDVPDFFSNWN